MFPINANQATFLPQVSAYISEEKPICIQAPPPNSLELQWCERGYTIRAGLGVAQAHF